MLLPAAHTKLAIVDQLLAVYDLNERVIIEKLAAYRRAQGAFVISVIFLAGAIVVRL